MFWSEVENAYCGGICICFRAFQIKWHENVTELCCFLSTWTAFEITVSTLWIIFQNNSLVSLLFIFLPQVFFTSWQLNDKLSDYTFHVVCHLCKIYYSSCSLQWPFYSPIEDDETKLNKLYWYLELRYLIHQWSYTITRDLMFREREKTWKMSPSFSIELPMPCPSLSQMFLNQVCRRV